MPPWLELITTAMDIISFILVTPLFLGEDNLKKFLIVFERFIIWIRTVWFGHDYEPMTPAQFTSMIFLIFVIILSFWGISFAVEWVMAIYIGFFFIFPAILVLLYFILLFLIKEFGLARIFAVIGGFIFLVGKSLVLMSSFQRLTF